MKVIIGKLVRIQHSHLYCDVDEETKAIDIHYREGVSKDEAKSGYLPCCKLFISGLRK